MQLMGIINVTPDSFHDGGKYRNLDDILRYVESIYEYVDILDIGGESTRPGCTPITSQVELDRICPVIEVIKKNFDKRISIDTYKSEVAQIAIDMGVDMINNVKGIDLEMAKIISNSHVDYCLTCFEQKKTMCIIKEISDILKKSLNFCLRHGLKKKQIIIDPGIGFNKTINENLCILKNINDLKSLGYPILVGYSHKSFIYKSLNIASEQCLEATLAITSLCAWNDIDIVRVHDVKENGLVIKMIKTIKHAPKDGY